MSEILLPHTPALPLAGFAAGPFGESSHLTAPGGWRQSTLEKEENSAEWMHRKQAKPALLPLSPTKDEGRRAARCADWSQELAENAASHGQEQGPGSRTRTQARARLHPRPAAHLPSSDSACESEKRPGKGREGKRAATASARSRGSPHSPLGPGARTPQRRPRPEGRRFTRVPAPGSR